MSAFLSCSIMAGSAWALASALSAMQEAGRTISDGAAHLKLAVADLPRPERLPVAVKSSRFARLSDSDLRGAQLTAEAVRLAHERTVAVELALADKREKADRVAFVASAAPAKASVKPVLAPDAKPTMMTALVEDVPAIENQPFDLVLSEPEREDDEDLALPSVIPLPEARPLIGTAMPEVKPEEPKPALRQKPEAEQELALVKPQRSLFGGLFSRKQTDGSWQGNDRKVAIYDVSAATVYLPDGTRLRAHSGIGSMRDNPRYDHVTMRGPTPAGIYRLSMREKRFYGVEAIRMTSIDGRDPKNRTGLLTHTNLLRGQIGSHGCVAFQNYQPFLNAFKRGQVKTLVVVPSLPSQTQLAALYRKAGA